MIRTAPVTKRKGRVAVEGCVLAWLTFMPSSLTSIPVKYLAPVPPWGEEPGLVFAGSDFVGELVDVLSGDVGPNKVACKLRRDQRTCLVFPQTFLTKVREI